MGESCRGSRRSRHDEMRAGSSNTLGNSSSLLLSWSREEEKGKKKGRIVRKAIGERECVFSGRRRRFSSLVKETLEQGLRREGAWCVCAGVVTVVEESAPVCFAHCASRGVIAPVLGAVAGGCVLWLCGRRDRRYSTRNWEGRQPC